MLRAIFALPLAVLLAAMAGVPSQSVPGALFFVSVWAALTFSLRQALANRLPLSPWRTARRLNVLLLFVVLPTAFAIHTSDVFNVAKFGVVSVAALILIALWTAERIWAGAWPAWPRYRLVAVVAALVVWTAVTTATSGSPAFSLLGAYGSYDGLIASLSFAILFLATAEAFDRRDLRRVLSVVYVGVLPTMLYGLVQLHDRFRLSGGLWDWNRWGGSYGSQIWSTYGNPDHLAGLLAIALPIGVALAWTTRTARARAALVATTLVGTAELLETASRGAFVAVLVGGGLLGFLGFGGRSRRRVAQLAAAVIGVSIFVAGAAWSIASALRSKNLVAFSGPSNVHARTEFWWAGLRMLFHHPWLGIGPDMYQNVFPRYQGPTWVRLFGPSAVVNGAHDIFIERAASSGFVGLILFVLVLALGARMLFQSWRSAGSWEAAGPQGHTSFSDRPLLLAGLAAAGAASVVQATFNVEQIGLTAYTWLLLGLVCATSGVPPDKPPSPTPMPEQRRPFTIAVRSTATLVTMATAGWAAFMVLGPVRADYAIHAADIIDRNPHPSVETAVKLHSLLRRAVVADPLEGHYRDLLGDDDVVMSRDVASPGGARFLDQAAGELRRAVQLLPGNAAVEVDYARALLAGAGLREGPQASDQAEAALRRAIADNPYGADAPLLLAQDLNSSGHPGDAAAVLDTALAKLPRDADLLRAAGELAEARADMARARELWRELLQVRPGDSEARSHLASSPATPTLAPG